MKRKALALLLMVTMTASMLAGCGNGDSGSQGSSQGGSQDSVAVGNTDNSGTSDSSSESAGSGEAQASTPKSAKESAARGEGETRTDENGNQIYTAPDGKEYYVDKDGDMYQRFDDVRLTLLYDWNGGTSMAKDQYNNEVATIIRNRIGVTVEFQEVYGDETEKINQVFASGEYPDIIEAPYWGGASTGTVAIKKAADDGILMDVSPYKDNYNWLWQAYEVGIVSQQYLNNDIDIYGGPLYVMPRKLTGSVLEDYPESYGVCVRGDVADALNIDPTSIKTSEQLYDFMKKAYDYGFKDANGNDTITVSTAHEGNYYHSLFVPFKEKKWTQLELDEDGKVTHEYLSDEFIERNLYVWKLVKEGIMDVECFTQSSDLADQKLGNGSVLFFCGKVSSPEKETKKSGLYDAHPEMRYELVGPLEFKGGEAMADPQLGGATGSHVMIFPETENNTENIEAALTYIDYLSSPEGILLTDFGVEGKDYTFDAEGDLVWTEEFLTRRKTDSDAQGEERKNMGMINKVSIADRRNEWFGKKRDLNDNETELLWESIVKVEYVPLDKQAITVFGKGFEGFNDVMANVLNEEKYRAEIERAYFADTEEGARKILEEYQDYVRNGEGFQELMDYFTEIYNSDPDHIVF